MVRVIDLEEESLVEKLKPAIYYIKSSPMIEFYLEKEQDKFTTPPRLFGSVKRRIEKIKTTFDNRDSNTGLLLTGDKGAGKTMLAEVLCNEMLSVGIPIIIIINDRYTGSNFTSFIDSLGVITLFFDEFGKLYPTRQKDTDEKNNSQESLLSLLDGVNRQKRLVIMTENSEQDINTFIKARPGRVYYHFKYRKLDEENIKDDVIELILDASRKMEEFSFDTLKAIVEEYQRFGTNENFEELLTDLNIEYDKDKKIRLKVVRLLEKATDETLEIEFMSEYQNKPTDYHDDIHIELKNNKNSNRNIDPDEPVAVNERGDKEWVRFSSYDIKYATDKKIIFETDDHLLITEIQEDYKSKYNYHAF